MMEKKSGVSGGNGYTVRGLLPTFKAATEFEQLLRLIYIHRIKTAYIEKDFVTMRTGGASTSGLKSHVTVMKERLQGVQEERDQEQRVPADVEVFHKVAGVWGKGRQVGVTTIGVI